MHGKATWAALTATVASSLIGGGSALAGWANNHRFANRDQYNRDRFNRDQYNRDRYNRDQYNRDQYNRNQYNRNQYNRDQYNRNQYNRDQYNRDRYNRDQANRDRYNTAWDSDLVNTVRSTTGRLADGTAATIAPQLVAGAWQLVATRADGSTVTGAALNGATLSSVNLTYTDSTGAPRATTAELRIDWSSTYKEFNESGSTTYEDPEIHVYHLGYRIDRAEDWARAPSPCGYGPYSTAAIPLLGSWNASGAHVPPASTDPTFTLACLPGAIAKCTYWGYKRWHGGSLSSTGTTMADLHQSCVRAVTADYCGDGQSHTYPGTLINIWDWVDGRSLVQPTSFTSCNPATAGSCKNMIDLEAAWTAAGAAALAYPRWAGGAVEERNRPEHNITARRIEHVLGGMVADGRGIFQRSAADCRLSFFANSVTSGPNYLPDGTPGKFTQLRRDHFASSPGVNDYLTRLATIKRLIEGALVQGATLYTEAGGHCGDGVCGDNECSTCWEDCTTCTGTAPVVPDTVWAVTADGLTRPVQRNPMPDRQGRAGVWSYRTGAVDLPLLPLFNLNAEQYEGWTWNESVRVDYQTHYDAAGMRVLARNQFTAVLAWRSPFAGRIGITAGWSGGYNPAGLCKWGLYAAGSATSGVSLRPGSAAVGATPLVEGVLPTEVTRTYLQEPGLSRSVANGDTLYLALAGDYCMATPVLNIKALEVDCAQLACDDGNPCTTDSCAPTTGCVNTDLANGSSCSDGNACTQGDSCQAGVCVGPTAVVCAPSDQCHVAGTCDPATGCSNPIKPNGSACSDGNACTQSDTCQNGSCAGANPVVCPAPDQCHLAGTCNPATGQCSNPSKPNGTACSDGQFCTATDTCQNGACTGTGARCGADQTCSEATDQCVANVVERFDGPTSGWSFGAGWAVAPWCAYAVSTGGLCHGSGTSYPASTTPSVASKAIAIPATGGTLRFQYRYSPDPAEYGTYDAFQVRLGSTVLVSLDAATKGAGTWQAHTYAIPSNLWGTTQTVQVSFHTRDAGYNAGWGAAVDDITIGP